MGWDMLPACILKVVSVVLRNLLFISISVDGEHVLSGRLPGHSFFCVAEHLYFKISSNVAVSIEVFLKETHKPLINVDNVVFIGAALPESLVGDHDIPNGTVALGGTWDLALWRQENT